jgi:hypothetical protein
MDKLDSENQSNVVSIEEGKSDMTSEAHPSVYDWEKYTKVPNDLIYNERLSHGAKFLLIYLLSHKPGFKVHDSTLKTKILHCGRDLLEGYFKELRKEGYVMNVPIVGEKMGAKAFKGSRRIFSRKPMFFPDSIVTTTPSKVKQNLDSLDFRGSRNSDPGDPENSRLPEIQGPENSGTRKPGPHITTTNPINNTNLINNPPIAPPGGRLKKSPPIYEPVFKNQFEEFWQYYPRKVKKGTAEKKYDDILSYNFSLHEIIIEALKAQATDWRARESVGLAVPSSDFIPYPATWLNAKGWLNVVITTREQLDDELRRRDSGQQGHHHKLTRRNRAFEESRRQFLAGESKPRERSCLDAPIGGRTLPEI